MTWHITTSPVVGQCCWRVATDIGEQVQLLGLEAVVGSCGPSGNPDDAAAAALLQS
jgi:hypothetical protein